MPALFFYEEAEKRGGSGQITKRLTEALSTGGCRTGAGVVVAESRRESGSFEPTETRNLPQMDFRDRSRG